MSNDLLILFTVSFHLVEEQGSNNRTYVAPEAGTAEIFQLLVNTKEYTVVHKHSTEIDYVT